MNERDGRGGGAAGAVEPATGGSGAPTGGSGVAGWLRPASDADRDRVLHWRNHPQVRRGSFHTAEISPAEHAAWWAAVRGNPRRRILIFEWEERPAGVVSYVEPEPRDGSALWSRYLDVADLRRRGELLPALVAAERAAIAYAFDDVGFATLRGDVLAWNTPVLDLHRRFGFRIVSSYERRIDGKAQAVVRTELTSHQWRAGARRLAVSRADAGIRR